MHVNTGSGARAPGPKPWFDMGQDENADYYPGYSYPPMNIYLTSERGMVFEFALAGFDEKDISLTFQGDYMVFSAKIGLEDLPDDDVRYFKRRLKLKDVEKQKYYVPGRQIRAGQGAGRFPQRHPQGNRPPEGRGRDSRGHQDRDPQRRRITGKPVEPWRSARQGLAFRGRTAAPDMWVAMKSALYAVKARPSTRESDSS